MQKTILIILLIHISTITLGQRLQELLDLSNTQWESQQYTEAFETLSEAVETAGLAYEQDEEGYAYSYAVILNQMGIRLFEAENYETAATYYEAAIPLFKTSEGAENDYLIALENLALCYSSGGFYGEAVNVYAILLANERYRNQVGEGIYQTYNSAAICAFQAENYDLAKRYYTQGLTYLTPDDPDYWVLVENLILLETTWGQNVAAYTYIQPLVAQFPEKAATYSNDIAYYYRDMGHQAFNQGDFSSAIPHFQKTIQHLRPTDSVARLSVIYIYEDISAAYSAIRNYVEGLPYMEKNAEQVKVHYGTMSEEYLYALNYLTIAYAELARYKQSNTHYKEAYRILRQMDGVTKAEFQALFDINYADYFIKRGDYEQAKFYVHRALEFYATDDALYLDDKIYALNMLGIVLLSEGKYDQAESALKNALRLQTTHRGLENGTGSNIASNLTSLYIQTGRNSRAEQFVQFVLANDLALHGPQSMEYSYSLQVAGVLYTSTNHYEKAIGYLTQAYNIREPLVGKDNRELLRLQKTLGAAYLKKGELNEAIRILHDVMAAQIASFGTKNFDLSLTQNDLGLAYLLNKEYRQALKLFEKAYQLDKEILGQYNQFTVTPQYNLGCTHLLMGNHEQAFDYFQKSIHDYLYILDKYFPHLSEKERLEYYQTIKGQLEAYFSFLSNHLDTHPEYAAVLYDLQMQTKAILLSESMKLRNLLSKHDNPKVQQLYLQWNEINKEIAQLEQIARDTESNQRLDSLKIVGEEYERELNAMTHLFADSKKKTWQHIAQTLEEGEVAVEIIRIRHFDFATNTYVNENVEYLALIIDHQTDEFPSFVRLKDGFLMESKYFNGYKNSMQYMQIDNRSYAYFWQPIAEQLKNYQKAYISSDGVYHLLNLNTLYNPSTEQYVIHELDLEIVGNTCELMDRTSDREGIENAVLFGFPAFNTQPDADTKDTQRTAVFQEVFSAGVSDLPATREEVKNISKLMSTEGIETNTFLAEDAGERNLKKIVSPGILHIATHGFFEESFEDVVSDDPLTHSGLLMAHLKETASIDEENGIVTAKEVAQMDLSDSKLVVLSACETGRGKIVNGEGVYGLQRAFQVAGAAHVIISLWKVDDTATQQLMTYFYDQYLKSGNPRDALKKAQIKLQADYPHPNYWGAFYVVGE